MRGERVRSLARGGLVVGWSLLREGGRGEQPARGPGLPARGPSSCPPRPGVGIPWSRALWSNFCGSGQDNSERGSPPGSRDHVGAEGPAGWRAERSGDALREAVGAHKRPGGAQRGCTGDPGMHGGAPGMRTGNRILSPVQGCRRSPPGSRWMPSPVHPGAPRPVPPLARLAGPFPGEAGGRGRPFPAAHLGTSLGPPRSGSFSHFTSH